MSNIFKGLSEAKITNYGPGDEETWPGYTGHPNDPRSPPRKKVRQEPDYDDEPYNPWDDYYRKQNQAMQKYKSEVDVQYSNKEGVAPNGERYNSAFLVKSKTPYQGDNEIYKFKDLHWGAKEIVDTEKKEPEKEGDPYLTLVYYVDNHKHGYFKPWKDEPPISKGVQFESTTKKNLIDLIFDKLEERYPNIVSNYGHEVVGDTIAKITKDQLGYKKIDDYVSAVKSLLDKRRNLSETSHSKQQLMNDYKNLNDQDFYAKYQIEKSKINQKLSGQLSDYLGPVGEIILSLFKEQKMQEAAIIPFLQGAAQGAAALSRGAPGALGAIATGLMPSGSSNTSNLGQISNIVAPESINENSIDAEQALQKAKKITGEYKYANMHIDIISKIAVLAEDVGIDKRELDYYIQDVIEKQNILESSIFNLITPFEDLVRNKDIDEGQIYMHGNKPAGLRGYKTRTVPNQHELNKESAIMKGLQTEGNDNEFHTGGGKGLPFPSTYEQEVKPFRTKGPKTTQAIAFEDQHLDEKWSDKYKRSIDCNNPKGFSQRAHCQGRKKK